MWICLSCGVNDFMTWVLSCEVWASTGVVNCVGSCWVQFYVKVFSFMSEFMWSCLCVKSLSSLSSSVLRQVFWVSGVWVQVLEPAVRLYLQIVYMVYHCFPVLDCPVDPGPVLLSCVLGAYYVSSPFLFCACAHCAWLRGPEFSCVWKVLVSFGTCIEPPVLTDVWTLAQPFALQEYSGFAQHSLFFSISTCYVSTVMLSSDLWSLVNSDQC